MNRTTKPERQLRDDYQRMVHLVWMLVDKLGGEVRIKPKDIMDTFLCWELAQKADEETGDLIFKATRKPPGT